MPETPEELWERARAGLRAPAVGEWDSWPFAGAVSPRELRPPEAEERWFIARPARFSQLASSFASIWDDVLPPIPDEVRRENVERIRRALAAGDER